MIRKLACIAKTQSSCNINDNEHTWLCLAMKILDPDYLVPKQFETVRMILLVLVFASNFVLLLVFVLALESLVKTRLNFVRFESKCPHYCDTFSVNCETTFLFSVTWINICSSAFEREELSYIQTSVQCVALLTVHSVDIYIFYAVIHLHLHA